jgi:hypothetical protein
MTCSIRVTHSERRTCIFLLCTRLHNRHGAECSVLHGNHSVHQEMDTILQNKAVSK